MRHPEPRRLLWQNPEELRPPALVVVPGLGSGNLCPESDTSSSDNPQCFRDAQGCGWLCLLPPMLSLCLSALGFEPRRKRKLY